MNGASQFIALPGAVLSAVLAYVYAERLPSEERETYCMFPIVNGLEALLLQDAPTEAPPLTVGRRRQLLLRGNVSALRAFAYWRTVFTARPRHERLMREWQLGRRIADETGSTTLVPLAAAMHGMATYAMFRRRNDRSESDIEKFLPWMPWLSLSSPLIALAIRSRGPLFRPRLGASCWMGVTLASIQSLQAIAQVLQAIEPVDMYESRRARSAMWGQHVQEREASRDGKELGWSEMVAEVGPAKFVLVMATGIVVVLVLAPVTLLGDIGTSARAITRQGWLRQARRLLHDDEA